MILACHIYRISTFSSKVSNITASQYDLMCFFVSYDDKLHIFELVVRESFNSFYATYTTTTNRLKRSRRLQP